MNKKLERSVTDRKLSGVCSGIATYFGIADVTIVRLVYALVTLFTGIALGVIVYIVMSVVIPEQSDVVK